MLLRTGLGSLSVSLVSWAILDKINLSLVQGMNGLWGLLVVCSAAAKSLQLCPTLCDPIDGSPPSSPIPGILQARTLEWVAISFSNAWKWKVKEKLLSCVRLLATPWTVAHQAPPSMGFSRQEYWSGVPLPSLVVCSRRMTILNSFHSWKFPFLIPPLGDDWSFPSLKKTKAIQEIFLILSSVYLRNMFLGIIFLWITQRRTSWLKVNSSTYAFQFTHFHL